MKLKVIAAVSSALVVLILLTGACLTGLMVGLLAEPVLKQATQAPGSSATLGLSPTEKTAGNTAALFKPFWEAWQIVHKQFVDQPVNDEKLMQGAIRGMLAALGDKHTAYMDPTQYSQANMPLREEYEGIGAFVDTSGKYLTIISPMHDSPAEKAGLKAGDMITAVDGKDMTGVDGNIVLNSVLGPAGSKVQLTIQRIGVVNPFDVELVRAKISLQSVTGKMLDNKIAYIQISSFADNTETELRKTLQELLDQKPAGLIIDLRNDGGGYLKTAIEVGSEFIDKGVLMYEVRGDGTRDQYPASGGGLATKIPMIVLVNEGTASASEIVAGAIQDYGRAPLVGVTTYGKGSVQIWTPLSNNEGTIRVTIARWLTPKERQINEIGLKPDYEVKMTDEDISAGRDPQLDKAIELLVKSR
jgi:carboxyl-terminal processing protease